MAIGIRFDGAHNPIEPTLILCKRSGDFIGRIPITDAHHEVNLNKANEFSFTVYKEMCPPEVWEKLIDLKLVYVKENDEFYQLTVSLDDKGDVYKSCSLVSLCEAELSQIMLNDYEINTEDDIARMDYEIATLWNEQYPKKSIIHRLFEKAPHYNLEHCDISLQGIQRAFSFDGRSLYDALQDIAEEYKCLFVFDNRADENNFPRRGVRVYDLQKHCLQCNYRGEFDGPCPKCGAEGDLIVDGYGEDTTIFVNSDNLADNINVTVDVDSMKNCFYLEAGDDLLTAAVRAVNPNGTQYLWHISPYMMEDMSDELVERVTSYNEQYEYYQNEHISTLPVNLLSSYNLLVSKYKSGKLDVDEIPSQIVGYQKLMEIYYQTIDFYLYLHDSMTPVTAKGSTTASQEASTITNKMGTISVYSTSTLSKASANNAVLARARVLASHNYKISIVSSNYSGTTWSGRLKLVSYTDDDDTAETTQFVVRFNDDYKAYLEQRIETQLSNNEAMEGGAVEIFKYSNTEFAKYLEKFAVEQLQILADCAQSCLDVLTQANQGSADSEYYSIYQDYYQKLLLVNQEIQVRESEVAVIQGLYDYRGNLKTDGVQTCLDSIIKEIQIALDFQTYIGTDLWHELCSYRREDVYSNQNYISDGLDTASLFARALDFLEIAQKEIITASTPQREITAPLKNLLVMKEFAPLLDNFKVGNWLRLEIDGEIYKLRLIHYETDYQDQLDVEFSDAIETVDGFSDAQSILDQAGIMATSFDAVKRQARRGNDTTNIYRDWVAKGLDLTNIKIVKNIEDNQEMTIDGHGILGREFNALSEDYDDKQIRIINKGMYFTNDAWEHVQAAIGNFVFWNPETREIEERYGVIADTLVGALILGEKVGIYTETGNIVLDENGFTLTTDQSIDPDSDMHFTIQKKYINKQGDEVVKKMLYTDSAGNLVMDGKSINITLSDYDELNEDSLDVYIQTLIQASQDQVLVQMSKEFEGYYGMSEINMLLDQIQMTIMENVENEYIKSSQLTQTIDSLTSTIMESVENEYVKTSQLSQTLDSFSSSIMAEVEKEYAKSSEVTQTVDGITATVQNLQYNQNTMKNELKSMVTVTMLNDSLSSVVTTSSFSKQYQTMLTQTPSLFKFGFTKNNTFIKFESGSIMLGTNKTEQELLLNGGYTTIGSTGMTLDGIGGIKSVKYSNSGTTIEGLKFDGWAGPKGRNGNFVGVGNVDSGSPYGLIVSRVKCGNVVGGRISALSNLDMLDHEILNATLKYPWLDYGTCDKTNISNCTFSGSSSTFNSSFITPLKSALGITGSSSSSPSTTTSGKTLSKSVWLLYDFDQTTLKYKDWNNANQSKAVLIPGSGTYYVSVSVKNGLIT